MESNDGYILFLSASDYGEGVQMRGGDRNVDVF